MGKWEFAKNVGTGSNISRTFEVGDASNYSPVDVTFANVMGSGNLLAKATATEHPQIATSDIIPDFSVNRYWTLTNVDGITFSTADVIFNWVAGDIDAGAVTSNFGVANYNGSTWSLTSIASPLSTSIQATGLTTFDDFAIGERTITPRWTGAIGTNWYTTGNWSTSSVPISTSNVLIPSSLSNYPTIASGTAVSNDLTIQSGASVTVTSAILQIGGTVSNSGTFTAADGTIVFNGSSAQNIPAATFANNTIKDLTINNTAGVTLGGTLNLTGALTISGGSLATGGYLTLKSTSTTVAYVAQITSASGTPITGNVTVERYIPARRKYRLITSSVTTSASPTLSVGEEALSIWGNWQNQGNVVTGNNGTFITGGTVGDGYDQQTQNASFFTYDDVNRRYTGFTSANGKNTKYTPLKAGVAYYMFVYGDRLNAYNTSTPNNTVLSATGILLTGDQTYTTASAIPLSNTTGRYTLLGNPFASPIDWTTISRTNLANTYWGWDPNLSSTGGYITVTNTGTVTLISPFTGTTGLNQYIQPGQGFVVQTTAASPVLTIEEQDKVSNFNGNAFKVDGENGSSEANTIPLMAINLQYSNGIGTILADGVLTAFDPFFSNGIGKEDASKIPNTGESIAILNSGQSLSIDARKMPQTDDTLFLNVARLTKPQYTLQIFAQQINNNIEAYLEDAYLHTKYSLSLTDTNKIVFNVNTDAASSDLNRFKVVFKTINAQAGTFTSIKATLKDKDIQVDWSVAEENSIKKYVVERSLDNTNFTKMYEVNAKGSNAIENYKWLDANAPTGNNYYRVLGIYNDGTYFISKTVQIQKIGNPEITVFPNPVRGLQINIRIKELEPGQYTLLLYNTQGQQMTMRAMNHPGGSTTQILQLNKKLPSGIYTLKITNKNANYIYSILIE
ncbi:MAG: T9SS type A sorting domain-containing protein [Chitinophagaceae bacterium]|nr:T9SS type A sorting domain-containing protein [Chitinophagaceae bacterium]